MGAKIIADDTILEKISSEIVITNVSGNANTITENGQEIVGVFNGLNLFVLDTQIIYRYYKGLWYEL